MRLESGVDAFVRREVPPRHEALVAVRALVRPLTGVDEDVRLEVWVLRERLPANL